MDMPDNLAALAVKFATYWHLDCNKSVRFVNFLPPHIHLCSGSYFSKQICPSIIALGKALSILEYLLFFIILNDDLERSMDKKRSGISLWILFCLIISRQMSWPSKQVFQMIFPGL